MRKTVLLIVLLFAALAARPASAQTTHLAVCVGLAGEPEHGEAFARWAATLVDGAERLGVAKEHIIYLADETATDPERITGRSSKVGVSKAFEKVATDGAHDVVFVVLFGIGTFDGKV